MNGGSSKFRLARCPRCLKLLVEYADIPVYPCGGCGATLRAKNRTAAGKNVMNSRSPEVDHSQSLSDIGSLDDVSTSSAKQMFACSTSAHSSELEHGEKETMLPNIYNHQENGETCGENGIEEHDSDTNQLGMHIRNKASQRQPDHEGVHSKTEAQKSPKPSQQPSESSINHVMNKVEEAPESVGRSVASEEDMAERGFGDPLDFSFRSPATRSTTHAYDASISSSDDGYSNHARDKYLRLSRRTYRQPKALDITADNKGKEGDEVSRSNLQKTIIRMHELSRETSFKSEDYHSVQNSMEPENIDIDSPYSRSPSRGSNFQHDFSNSKSSKYLGYGGMDLLRKMFELKKQLHGLCNQSAEGGEPDHLRGSSDGQQPLHQKSEHQPPRYLNSNLLHHPPEAIYGHQLSQMPFSAQRCCTTTCLHCCLDGRELQLRANHCTDGMCCRAHACKLCSHSSTAGIRSGTPHHEQEKLRYNEKIKRKKSVCRPIFGGAPFIICCNCFELLRLPADCLVSRRRLINKLQCTACSEVLELSFPAIDHISPRSPSKVVRPCNNKVGNCTDAATGSVSRSDCSRGEPVSFSEVYGLSFTKSFSTEAEPVLHVSRNSSQGKNDTQKSCLPLHRLMGYSSASELLYRHWWDIDEGYESIESMVPHSYRPSQESHAIDGLREQGKSTTSCHKQIGPCTNPDCMEIHEEEESPRPL